MEENLIHDNPLAFWAGLVLTFIGVAGVVFYLMVRTANENLIMPGPTFRLKHFLVALGIAVVGVVIASFARPRRIGISDATTLTE